MVVAVVETAEAEVLEEEEQAAAAAAAAMRLSTLSIQEGIEGSLQPPQAAPHPGLPLYGSLCVVGAPAAQHTHSTWLVRQPQQPGVSW